MKKITFAYTLSSKNSMVKEAVRSIKSLKNQIREKDDIVIYYTPPYDDEDYRELSRLAEVRKISNKTPEFSVKPFEEKGHYGEKVNICEIETDNLVFLDCDTLVLDDIYEVIRGDFDFKARPGSTTIDETEWHNLFSENDEEYMDWMPNAGFLVFKNSFHRKIAEKWQDYISQELNYELEGMKHKEQYALALAVSDGKCKKMSENEHVMEWSDRSNSKGIVYHLETQDNFSALGLIMNSIHRKLP